MKLLNRHRWRRSITALLAVFAGTQILGLLVQAQAPPPLELELTPESVILSWDRDLGMDYVLKASDDLVNWQLVKQSIILDGGQNRVAIPTDIANEFYALMGNDGSEFQAAYAGSENCKTCHSAIYNTFVQSGHPYKLNKVNDGVPPTYPFTSVPNPPDGWTWDMISYVIGGANWKARFVDLEGYIVTGDAVQYNLETEGWVGYHADEEIGTKPYNCGKCHTTGWLPTADRAVHQDGIPGMAGAFAATGVQCEACHGPGGRHVKTVSASDITKDRSSEQCGTCHFRNADHTIAAKGGFIRHHEQYDEMIAAGHQVLSCNDCHNPHVTVRHGQVGGITKNCTDCHQAYAATSHNGATCTDCHMPEATKSAVAKNKYNGDVKTHIFKINADPNGQMFNEAGSLANGAVTLDYVCYTCHNDPEGIGGGGPALTMEELAALAPNIHQ